MRLFVFVEFNGGNATATAMTCCRPFSFYLFFSFFFLFPYLSPYRPYADTFFLLFVLFFSVKQQFTYVVPHAAFPFLYDLLASHYSEHLPVFCFLFSFLLFFFSWSLLYGLACFVVFSYPVR